MRRFAYRFGINATWIIQELNFKCNFLRQSADHWQLCCWQKLTFQRTIRISAKHFLFKRLVLLIFKMKYLHPIHNLKISTDIIDCLLEEFGEIINSKRLRSQINTIAELIDVIWKRNIFSNDQNALNTILKYISVSEEREVVQNYIGILDQNGSADGSTNVYGVCMNYLNFRETLFIILSNKNQSQFDYSTNSRGNCDSSNSFILRSNDNTHLSFILRCSDTHLSSIIFQCTQFT